MRRAVTTDDLMRYLDDELSSEERARVGEALTASTELQRELAIYRGIQEGMRDLSFARQEAASVWDQVDRRLTRPVGWVLVVVGAVVWAAYAGWVFATSSVNPWEKVAVGSLVIGFLILLSSTIFERVREFRTDPYRDIER